jgi:hypothetical protein
VDEASTGSTLIDAIGVELAPSSRHRSLYDKSPSKLSISAWLRRKQWLQCKCSLDSRSLQRRLPLLLPKGM